MAVQMELRTKESLKKTPKTHKTVAVKALLVTALILGYWYFEQSYQKALKSSSLITNRKQICFCRVLYYYEIILIHYLLHIFLFSPWSFYPNHNILLLLGCYQGGCWWGAFFTHRPLNGKWVVMWCGNFSISLLFQQ